MNTEFNFINTPWGGHRVLMRSDADGFLTKYLVFKPGQRSSLQYHSHRTEHWYLVSGTVRFTLGDKTMLLTAPTSVDVAQGQLHRLENIGKSDAVVVETWRGELLSEEDVVRLEDDYGRVAV